MLFGLAVLVSFGAAAISYAVGTTIGIVFVTLQRFVQVLATQGRKGGPVYTEVAVRLRELASFYRHQAVAR